MPGQSTDLLTVASDEAAVRQEEGSIGGEGLVENSKYPSSIKLSFILLSLSLAVFLYGLVSLLSLVVPLTRYAAHCPIFKDQTIIATAIPKITDDFDALGDVGWYASAYLLTSSAFQLLFGKMFTIFSVKFVYLSAVAIFELGSLICAAAPNSVSFIVGRAIAGIGAAGVYSGSVIVLTHSAPLDRRPMYTGILGAAVGVASIVGPFLGGTFA
jgi:MFS family permease